MSSYVKKPAMYVLAYKRGKWSSVPNPVFDEDWGVDEDYPGNFGYSQLFMSRPVDIFIDDSADRPDCEYPYLVQVRFTHPMEVIPVADIQSLIELWDRLSVIFDLKHEEQL